MLVDTESFEVFSQRGLDALVKSWEVGTSVLLDLTLKAVQFLLLTDVGANLNGVVVELGVNSGSFNNESTLAIWVSDVDSEVTVVLSLGSLLIIITVLLLFGKLVIIGDWLSEEDRTRRISAAKTYVNQPLFL